MPQITQLWQISLLFDKKATHNLVNIQTNCTSSSSVIQSIRKNKTHTSNIKVSEKFHFSHHVWSLNILSPSRISYAVNFFFFDCCFSLPYSVFNCSLCFVLCTFIYAFYIFFFRRQLLCDYTFLNAFERLKCLSAVLCYFSFCAKCEWEESQVQLK